MLDTLSKNVISLELAKKLVDLGFKEESIHSYILSEWGMIDGESYNDRMLLTYTPMSKKSDNSWPAYLASELMEFIPSYLDINKNHPFNGYRFIMQIARLDFNGMIQRCYVLNYNCDTLQVDSDNPFFAVHLIRPSIFDPNLCNALAKLFIYLLEDKHVQSDL